MRRWLRDPHVPLVVSFRLSANVDLYGWQICLVSKYTKVTDNSKALVAKNNIYTLILIGPQPCIAPPNQTLCDTQFTYIRRLRQVIFRPNHDALSVLYTPIWTLGSLFPWLIVAIPTTLNCLVFPWSILYTINNDWCFGSESATQSKRWWSGAGYIYL